MEIWSLAKCPAVLYKSASPERRERHNTGGGVVVVSSPNMVWDDWRLFLHPVYSATCLFDGNGVCVCVVIRSVPLYHIGGTFMSIMPCVSWELISKYGEWIQRRDRNMLITLKKNNKSDVGLFFI